MVKALSDSKAYRLLTILLPGALPHKKCFIPVWLQCFLLLWYKVWSLRDTAITVLMISYQPNAYHLHHRRRGHVFMLLGSGGQTTPHYFSLLLFLLRSNKFLSSPLGLVDSYMFQRFIWDILLKWIFRRLYMLALLL